MKPTPIAFGTKFAASIVAVLSCHDRVLFKGYLPFGGDDHLNRFVDHGLKMRRMDFLPFVEQQSEALVRHAQTQAQQADAVYRYFETKPDKDVLVRQLLRERPRRDGLVAVFCVKECCRTVKLLHGQGRPRLAFCRRPHRVLYYYFLDPDFGLMHVRLQTWFPFTIQVYVNGHEWLARQMLDHRLGFEQHDNAFTQLDDPAKAQQLADRFPQLPWVTILNRWVAQVNPLLGQSWLGRRDYYWVIDQAEYSTDVLFRDRAALADLYPRLLDHALLNFSASDILTFLGRRLHARFDGEVLTDCKKDRLPGARIKHRVKNNWLKMYDKFALILRIETVINQSREFRVRRWRTRRGRRQLRWCPMNKGVANFYHYHAVARAANQRYLDALAAVHPVSDSTQHFDRVSKPASFQGRRRRPLNLLAGSEQRLFKAVLQGAHRLHGFRNADIARALFSGPVRTLAEQRRRTAHVSRLLQLLRAHGLIAKLPHSYRYRITNKGEVVMSAALYMRHRALDKLLKLLDEAA
jgi:hypothetical protein